MAEKIEPKDIHVYPSDIEERPGGPVPLFLKLTYAGLAAFGVLYFVLYHAGDGSPLVRLLNAATGHAP